METLHDVAEVAIRLINDGNPALAAEELRRGLRLPSPNADDLEERAWRDSAELALRRFGRLRGLDRSVLGVYVENVAANLSARRNHLRNGAKASDLRDMTEKATDLIRPLFDEAEEPLAGRIVKILIGIQQDQLEDWAETPPDPEKMSRKEANDFVVRHGRDGCMEAATYWACQKAIDLVREAGVRDVQAMRLLQLNAVWCSEDGDVGCRYCDCEFDNSERGLPEDEITWDMMEHGKDCPLLAKDVASHGHEGALSEAALKLEKAARAFFKHKGSINEALFEDELAKWLNSFSNVAAGMKGADGRPIPGDEERISRAVERAVKQTLYNAGVKFDDVEARAEGLFRDYPWMLAGDLTVPTTPMAQEDLESRGTKPSPTSAKRIAEAASRMRRALDEAKRELGCGSLSEGPAYARRAYGILRQAQLEADGEACPKCGQTEEKGGEYPCEECGRPTIHDAVQGEEVAPGEIEALMSGLDRDSKANDDLRSERLLLRMWLRSVLAVALDTKLDGVDRALAVSRTSPLIQAIDEYFEKHPWTEDDQTVRGEANRKALVSALSEKKPATLVHTGRPTPSGCYSWGWDCARGCHACEAAGRIWGA